MPGLTWLAHTWFFSDVDCSFAYALFFPSLSNAMLDLRFFLFFFLYSSRFYSFTGRFPYQESRRVVALFYAQTQVLLLPPSRLACPCSLVPKSPSRLGGGSSKQYRRCMYIVSTAPSSHFKLLKPHPIRIF